MNTPTGAFRGNMSIRIDPTVATSQDDDAKVQEDQAAKDAKLITNLASLSNSPGWMILREQLEERIAAYKSGRTIAINIASNVTDEDLGKMMRVEALVAQELATVLNTVDIAVTEVEQRKTEVRRAGRQTAERA